MSAFTPPEMPAQLRAALDENDQIIQGKLQFLAFAETLLLNKPFGDFFEANLMGRYSGMQVKMGMIHTINSTKKELETAPSGQLGSIISSHLLALAQYEITMHGISYEDVPDTNELFHVLSMAAMPQARWVKVLAIREGVIGHIMQQIGELTGPEDAEFVLNYYADASLYLTAASRYTSFLEAQDTVNPPNPPMA